MAPLAERLAGKDMLIDSNLLVLLVVGLVRPESVGGKRLEKYTLPHFEALCETIVSAGRVILTPHVLAETSNLVKMALYGAPLREALAVLMLDELPFGNENSRQAKVVLERHVPKISLSLEIVSRLGVADAGLLSAAMTERHVLVTDDADLYWARCLRAVTRKISTMCGMNSAAVSFPLMCGSIFDPAVDCGQSTAGTAA